MHSAPFLAASVRDYRLPLHGQREVSDARGPGVLLRVPGRATLPTSVMSGMARFPRPRAYPGRPCR
jgi:hypothetical protein